VSGRKGRSSAGFRNKRLRIFIVPAVCGVFAGRIRALRGKDQGRKNVGGVSRANEAVGRLS
jgi:hypothetical protein